MAWPYERDNVDYLKYLEEYSISGGDGPQLSKGEWLKMRKQPIDSLFDEQKPARVSRL